MHNHLKDATEAKVQDAIQFVRLWIANGLDRDRAIARVLDGSTFGPVLRERVAKEA